MSLYETARALNLDCIIVPIVSLSSWYNSTSRFFTSKFYLLNRGSSGADEGHPTDGWGVSLLHSKIRWLNRQPGPKTSNKSAKEKTDVEKADDKASTAKDLK
jgi:hypothetical protein